MFPTLLSSKITSSVKFKHLIYKWKSNIVCDYISDQFLLCKRLHSELPKTSVHRKAVDLSSCPHTYRWKVKGGASLWLWKNTGFNFTEETAIWELRKLHCQIFIPLIKTKRSLNCSPALNGLRENYNKKWMTCFKINHI